MCLTPFPPFHRLLCIFPCTSFILSSQSLSSLLFKSFLRSPLSLFCLAHFQLLFLHVFHSFPPPSSLLTPIHSSSRLSASRFTFLTFLLILVCCLPLPYILPFSLLSTCVPLLFTPLYIPPFRDHLLSSRFPSPHRTFQPSSLTFHLDLSAPTSIFPLYSALLFPPPTPFFPICCFNLLFFVFTSHSHLSTFHSNLSASRSYLSASFSNLSASSLIFPLQSVCLELYSFRLPFQSFRLPL